MARTHVIRRVLGIPHLGDKRENGRTKLGLDFIWARCSWQWSGRRWSGRRWSWGRASELWRRLFFCGWRQRHLGQFGDTGQYAVESLHNQRYIDLIVETANEGWRLIVHHTLMVCLDLGEGLGRPYVVHSVRGL
jgi:hypothetical protein